MGNKLVEKYPIMKALDAAFEEQGLKIFILLRLSPIIPFNAINYIAGVTPMSLRDYCLALFFILPGTVLYCFVGASAVSLADSENAGNQTVTIVSIVVGIVFGFLAVFAVSYYAKKEFGKITAGLQEKQDEEDGCTTGQGGDDERQAESVELGV